MAAAPRTRLAPCLNRRGVLALAATPLWPSCPHAADARLPPNAAALERIQSLRPNQSLRLGHAKVIGEFNATALEFGLDRTGPRARDFCRKMVWAPERRRALFAGANHGTPHRLNDVWEFDLAAMSWLLVYAPDLPRTYGGLGPDASDVEFRDGVLMTRRGGPAVIGHTWSGLTYDAEQRGMLFMNTWPINVDPLVKQVGGDPGQQYRGPPLWRFDAAARRWSVVKTPEPWPKAAVGALLEWVPELGGSVWHLNNWQLSASWLLDSGHGAWRVIADAKSSPGLSAITTRCERESSRSTGTTPFTSTPALAGGPAVSPRAQSTGTTPIQAFIGIRRPALDCSSTSGTDGYMLTTQTRRAGGRSSRTASRCRPAHVCWRSSTNNSTFSL
jgi:hypothetical protein